MSDELDIGAIEAGIVVWERDELQRECRALLAEVRRLTEERDAARLAARAGTEARTGLERVRRERDEARAELQQARAMLRDTLRERDAYRRAKGENDERFMLERDEARAALQSARVEGARVMREQTAEILNECAAGLGNEPVEREIRAMIVAIKLDIRVLDPATVVGSGSPEPIWVGLERRESDANANLWIPLIVGPFTKAQAIQWATEGTYREAMPVVGSGS